MTEFGCDKWRLDGVGDDVAILRCPQTDANENYGDDIVQMPNFDAAERVRIAEELDCEHCEFRADIKKETAARIAGKIIVSSCGYCPRSYREADDVFNPKSVKFYCKDLRLKVVGFGDDWDKIDPDCPLPPVQTVVERTITKRIVAKSCYEPRPLSSLDTSETFVARRDPKSNCYDASGR